jgi:hypothetical protein
MPSGSYEACGVLRCVLCVALCVVRCVVCGVVCGVVCCVSFGSCCFLGFYISRLCSPVSKMGVRGRASREEGGETGDGRERAQRGNGSY